MKNNIRLSLLLTLITTACIRPAIGQANEKSLNFCDITCVNNVYRSYCGDAKCTTGASDYAQIFTLCTEQCAGAVAGEIMSRCLNKSVPDRSDWDNVQKSVVQEISSFCAGFDIAVDPNVKPLSAKDTDPKLVSTLFDHPEGEEKEGGKEKKKAKKKSTKKTKKKTAKKANGTEEKEERKKAPNTKKSKPASKKTTTKPSKKNTTTKQGRKTVPTKTVQKLPTRGKEAPSTTPNKTKTRKDSVVTEGIKKKPKCRKGSATEKC